MPKRALLLGLKLAVSAGLLWWLWDRFDFSSAFATIATMDWRLVTAAFAVLLMHGVLSAWRWRTILRLQGSTLPWPDALRLFFIAMFFNQTLSTNVAGDAARVLMLRGQDGMTAGHLTISVVLERAAGLLALSPLIMTGFWLLPPPVNPLFAALLLFAASLPLIFVSMSSFRRSNKRWLAASGQLGQTARVILHSAAGLPVLVQSIMIHLGAGLAVFLLAEAADASPGLWVCLALTPPVLLLATLPISFGGWGPREAALIWLFGLFGIAAAPALAVSVALGLLVMAAGLPGGLLWLSRSARTPSTG